MVLEVGQAAYTHPVIETGASGVAVGVGVSVRVAVGVAVSVGVGVAVLVGVLVEVGVGVANSSAGDEQDKIERINTKAAVHKARLWKVFMVPSRGNLHDYILSSQEMKNLVN
jgi:hypothetical protein